MPQYHGQGIDVSEAEERYLRRAFRRFALPYLLVTAALAAVVATALSGAGRSSAPDELSSLRDEIAAAKDAIAALETRVEPIEGRLSRVSTDLEKAGRRMAALESRTSEPSGDLESEVRDAARRVAALEERIARDAVAERIDALAVRMKRIEDAARTAPSAPLPAAPAQ